MPFLRSVCADLPNEEHYPFSIASITALETESIKLHPKVTFFVGENGSGKSTLLEGIADKWGFASESGNRSQSVSLRSYHTELAEYLIIERSPGIGPMDGFFSKSRKFIQFCDRIRGVRA